MARYSKNPNAPSAEDKALDRFTDLMIDKIKSIKEDWQKPWFTEGALAWPRNLTGRRYNGGNALMLMLHAEKEGYKLPVWCTFNSIQKVFNPERKEGDQQEPVHVMKGEKSFPVFLTTFTVIHKETKAKIPYDDYKKLSRDEQKEYNVYPKNQVFSVFNVAQTNLQQVRPELYAKLEEQFKGKRSEIGESFSFPAVDAMIANNAWVCPIKPQHQDKAYYSISRDEIVVPEKSQFPIPENFYGTLLHEMTHSTGSADRLNRLKASAFGDKDYAREELVAELGSALVMQQQGVQKTLKNDSAAYLKAWLDSLEESPDFIRNVMSDVKKASSVISHRIEEINERLDNGLTVEPYTREDAVLNPDLVPETVPFKEQPKEEAAAMGIPQGARMRQVDVMALFGALQKNGEAKLSDHFIPEEDEREAKEIEREETVQEDDDRSFRRGR